MKTAWIKPCLVAVTLIIGVTANKAKAQSIGEKTFKQQCAACHAVTADAPPGSGPNLHKIIGREAGILKGFAYSGEFKKALSGKKWTPDLLQSWLEDPQDVAPGTYMMYKQGNEEIRKIVIDYLQSLN
jgi:cytochrome c